MNLAKHSVRLLAAAAFGCALLVTGAQMGCEPAGNGVAPREPAPREPAPPPPPPRDPYDDPMDQPTDPQPGTQPGTAPGT